MPHLIDKMHFKKTTLTPYQIYYMKIIVIGAKDAEDLIGMENIWKLLPARRIRCFFHVVKNIESALSLFLKKWHDAGDDNSNQSIKDF